MIRTVPVPTSTDLAAAREVIARHLKPTPLVSSADGAWLKMETFQPTGSFKVRGALVALSTIAATGPIVTASAGNHALGVAWASQRLGVPATIVVAEGAAPVKIAKLRAMGADLNLHGASYDEAEAHAIALASDGGHFLSPYNDTQVIAGQSTLLDELLAQVPHDDRPLTLIVPVGGGGLLAGLSLRAAEITSREIRLIGVEAEASRAVTAGMTAGRTIEIPIGETLADGLAGNVEPGSVTVDILREQQVEIVGVSEEEIRDGIRMLFRDHGLVVEGSAATSIAALRRQPALEDGYTVAVVTGRNITWPVLRDILDETGSSA